MLLVGNTENVLEYIEKLLLQLFKIIYSLMKKYSFIWDIDIFLIFLCW